ncbi:MAG: MFS transporter [Candidatus Aenigmarchaeota archaeon]|nr:MFS transporter [Candidatus Aenigmarchaeota archaeon]
MKLNLSKKMFKVFIFLSLVSLFADMTYEGGRSIFGSYAKILGASALLASLATAGEFLGYISRFISGMIATRLKSSKVYWGLTISGYVVNLIAIPLLAFSRNWFIAILLIFLERIGKGLRSPARDVILAEVTEKMGRGKAFGLHETLDQIGAVAGPLIVSISLFVTNSNYPITFLILAIPAFLSLFFLFGAYLEYPNVKAAEKNFEKKSFKSKDNMKIFWLYSIAMSLVSLGFISWVNVSYILKASNVFPDYSIATFYLIAMLADGLLALPIGLMYDKFGLVSLIFAPIASILIIPFLFTQNFISVAIASVFWGIVMAIYESNARAAIADILPENKRAFGYGVFGLGFGIAWMIGSAIYGYLYEISPSLIVYFAIITEAVAFILLYVLNILKNSK